MLKHLCNSMPKARNLLPCLLVLAAALPATPAVAAPDIYRGLETKPADPAYTYARTVFDCFPPDSLTVTLGSLTTLSDSTIGRTNLINSYPCALWPEASPELVYRLNVATDLRLSAILSDLGPVDLDLFLLNDCDSDSCLVGASLEFGINLTAGIYYLVVDGSSRPSVSAGTFTLTLSTRVLGVPEVVCAPGGALPVDCAGDLITIVGDNLFEQPNLINEFSCGLFPRTGGELWYRITLPGTQQVAINLRDVSEVLDPNLWLFAGCGPDAQCLQYADANLAGVGESLTWVNSSESAMTAYLAVDAARPPASIFGGQYTIDFQCQSNVPTTATSLGSLKSLYR
jgi:hypothetical protein